MATEISPNALLGASLFAPAAALSELRDPEPVLNRLIGKDLIRPVPNKPGHYNITPTGREFDPVAVSSTPARSLSSTNRATSSMARPFASGLRRQTA
jgi:hypothetical protein